MKPLKEIRLSHDLTPISVNSHAKYFLERKIDWDVYLPSRGFNLQREYVWNLNQKRELINSILIKRDIPTISVINTVDENDIAGGDIVQIIDGKQRLSTVKLFLEDEFSLIIEEKEYLFSQLPSEYQRGIEMYLFNIREINEPIDKPITDEQKITWFKFINFAGTEQDKEHLEKL